MARMSIRMMAAPALLGVALGASSASAMVLSEFLSRADALKAKGALAIFHPLEIKELTAEVKSAVNDYRADATRAKARGDTSFGCPPPEDEVHLNTAELLSSFRALPNQHLSVKSSFYEVMRTRYPCR